MKCRLCGSQKTLCIGTPAYRQPPKIAGVNVYVDDLELGLMKCTECEYYFIDPVIPSERVSECYESASDQWATGQSVADSRSYSEKKELISKFSPDGKKVLNFGCYDGGFDEFLGYKYERFGIEPSISAAKEASKRGVKIIGSMLQDVDVTDYKFDIITLFDVAEHLVRPAEDFSMLSAMLTDNGIIMFETGDMDAFPWESLITLNPYSAIYEHTGFFNFKSVTKLAEILELNLIHFERTVHNKISHVDLLKRQAKIAIYFAIKMLNYLKLPMNTKLKNISNGPVPVPPKRKDHFLAILKKY